MRRAEIRVSVEMILTTKSQIPGVEIIRGGGRCGDHFESPGSWLPEAYILSSIWSHNVIAIVKSYDHFVRA